MFLIFQAQWEIELSSSVQKGFGAIILHGRMASQDGNRYGGPLAVGICGQVTLSGPPAVLPICQN